MTDFPDRDEWTDKPDSPESQKAESLRLKAEAEEAMEDAEWDALGETDLIDQDELLKIIDTLPPTVSQRTRDGIAENIKKVPIHYVPELPPTKDPVYEPEVIVVKVDWIRPTDLSNNEFSDV